MMSPFDSESGQPGLAQLWREAPRRLQRRPWVVAAAVAGAKVIGVLAGLALAALFALRWIRRRREP